MAHQRVNFIFVSPLDAQDPAVIEAGRHIERQKVEVIGSDGKPTPLRVITVPAGQEVPTTAQLLVIPQPQMQDAANYRALTTLLARQPNVVLRDDKECAVVSVEHARSRGFTDGEITAQLMPWVGMAQDAARKAVLDAEAKLEQARADLAATFAPAPSVAGPSYLIENPLVEKTPDAFDKALEQKAPETQAA